MADKLGNFVQKFETVCKNVNELLFPSEDSEDVEELFHENLVELAGVEDEELVASVVDTEKTVNYVREELLVKFKTILAERQELRRKNLFLQKKMVEFFKKRKMDHALKEDPKGLDLESKYLNRLFELQVYKYHVATAGKNITANIEDLQKETGKLCDSVSSQRQEFLSRQRQVALVLEIKKTKKKISKQAVATFLSQQASNLNALSAAGLKEIKMKRALNNRRDLLDEMENLGDGISRGFFEQQKFKKQAASTQFIEKLEETSQLQEKVRKVVQSLTNCKQKEDRLQRELMTLEKDLNRLEADLTEARNRLYNMGRHRDKLRLDSEMLLSQSGLLTRDNLLLDFESSLQTSTNLWRKLEKEEVSYRARIVRKRGGQVNTPINFFAVPDRKEEDDRGEQFWTDPDEDDC